MPLIRYSDKQLRGAGLRTIQQQEEGREQIRKVASRRRTGRRSARS
jgi:hypothetical protein